MRRPRFLLVWALFSGLYLASAFFGPHGPWRHGRWLPVNQHMLQVRSWLGDGKARPSLELTATLDPHDLSVASVAWADVAIVPRVEAGPPSAGKHCFLGFPPGPAYLLLPLWLLLHGWLAAQWVGAILGGLAVAALDALLRRWLSALQGTRETPPTRPSRNALTLLAGLGTLWVWLVPQGTVWQFAQTVGTTGLTLALLAAWSRRWLLCGLAFAFAVTSRPAMIFALPLILWMIRGIPAPSRRSAWARFAAVPLLFSGVTLLLNQLRFGSPFEFGYRFMLLARELEFRWQTHGQFSLAYLPENVRWLFLQPPVPARDIVSHQPGFPWLISDPMGMGVFFVTPAYLAALWTLQPALLRRRSVQVAWICLLGCTIPSLCYYTTGWIQWGGRFLLDAWPFWLMLAALGLSRLPAWTGWLLIGLSLLSNLWAGLLTTAGLWPR